MEINMLNDQFKLVWVSLENPKVSLVWKEEKKLVNENLKRRESWMWGMIGNLVMNENSGIIMNHPWLLQIHVLSI